MSNNIYYKYKNIKNDYYRLEHEYNIYANGILFRKKIIKHQQFYINKNIIVKENFEVIIENDFKKLEVELFLHRVNREGFGSIILEIPNQDNFINISYLIENASSNLEKINENKNNISSNLTKINEISNKLFIKNLYNDLINNFRIYFYEKQYNIEYNKNDFIEMNFKLLLIYNNIDHSNYIKSIYEIRDDGNNILYVKNCS